MVEIMQKSCKMEQKWIKGAPRLGNPTPPEPNPCSHVQPMQAMRAGSNSNRSHRKPVDWIFVLHYNMSTGPCSRVQTCRQDDFPMEKPVDSLDAGIPAEGENRAFQEALHSSKILPITLNPNRISQNVQHKNCRGETDLKLHRRKRKKRMSQFWDIAGGATCNSRRWNPNSAEKQSLSLIRISI